MRVPPSLLALALAIAPAAANGAEPGEPFDRLVERERAALVMHATRSLSSFAPPASAPAARPALDCVHAAHDITIDPHTGNTDATLALRVRATTKPLASLSFAIDGGLAPGKITASGGHDVTSNDATFAGTRVVRVDLDPPLAPGEETVVTMPYAGTLGCALSELGSTVCSKSADFAFFTQQSIFPFVFATEAADDALWDGLTRDIVLRVPAADDVVVTGQKLDEAIDGAQRVSRWSIGQPLSRTVGIYALVGKLGEATVAGRSVPTTFYHPTPRVSADDDLVDWSSAALDFIEKTTGAKLPFATNLSLVRLPQALGDPGTATFGMTLLSDSYAKTGELMYEETWAHENAHLFWGVVIPEIDSNESRLMSEGMATLMQIEYTHGRHFASEDRDAYLARRFVPMGIDVRVTGRDLPPLLVRKGEPMTLSRTRRYTMWAYYRTAMTLDHLRVTVGEDVFAQALAGYRERCSYVGCRPDDLRTAVEDASGKDLSAFFDRWVTAKERPRVRIGFAPTAGGADVELTKDDERPMTLELWLGTAGDRVRRRVDLGGTVTRMHLDAGAPVLSVSANPRHDPLVDIRSAVAGDLDFDGEVDGFDVLRCAPLVGRTYDPKPAGGLWDPHASFDARCDVNDDLTIDDRDLAELEASFGTLRVR